MKSTASLWIEQLKTRYQLDEGFLMPLDGNELYIEPIDIMNIHQIFLVDVW